MIGGRGGRGGRDGLRQGLNLLVLKSVKDFRNFRSGQQPGQGKAAGSRISFVADPIAKSAAGESAALPRT